MDSSDFWTDSGDALLVGVEFSGRQKASEFLGLLGGVLEKSGYENRVNVSILPDGLVEIDLVYGEDMSDEAESCASLIEEAIRDMDLE
jgi:hypothetical protein